MSRTHKRKRVDSSASVQRSGSRKWLGAAMMAVGVLLLAVVAFLLIGQNQPNGSVNAKGPRLEVDQTSVDYGQVKLNTPIETVFTLRNTGDAPLVIEKTPQVELIEGC
ncbi:MAG: DUF1573 domain-containing protein [Caldilineales bacterium]|nr:DUF1573 domain-containing protein [Caldilineales bacterium]